MPGYTALNHKGEEEIILSDRYCRFWNELATRVAAEGGRPELGIAMLDELIPTINDERLRKQLIERRMWLELEIDLNTIDAAVADGVLSQIGYWTVAWKRGAVDEADARVDAAMGLYARLRETLKKANPVLVRELLAETIDKVEVWSKPVPRGRRRVFQLQRGVIYLRGSQLENLSRSSRPALPAS